MTSDPGEWIPFFLVRHRDRFAPHDWPADSTDEYIDMLTDWLDAFRAGGVSEDEANRASRRLSLSPPRWKREHLPAVVETIKTMRIERAPAGEFVTTRDGAAALSKNCPRCDGQGLATIVGKIEIRGEILDYNASAHCVCPLGRFMRAKLAQQDEHTFRRIPDLERLPWGWRELHEPEVVGATDHVETSR